MLSDQYQIIVVGSGHAGCEAALSAGRMGTEVLLLTMHLDFIGQMSCNPAIGGLAKGHLVKEIDALGGEMAVNTDASAIQYRILNRSKGPAVWSSRAQTDRMEYRSRMKETVEKEKKITVFQGEADAVLVEKGRVKGVLLSTGEKLYSQTVILAPGTFLGGLIHIGLFNYSAGRIGEFPARHLGESI